MSSNLELLIKQNALAINSLKESAKSIDQLPSHPSNPIVDDLIMLNIDSSKQTVSVSLQKLADSLSLIISGMSGLTAEQVKVIIIEFCSPGEGLNIVHNEVTDLLEFSLEGESFTTANLTKLNGIAEEANKYVHPDTHPASIIVQSALLRFVTDANKTYWNNKQESIVDSNNIILSQYLPSFVDDVIDGTFVNNTTFNNKNGVAVTPEGGKIYIDTTTNKSYRWSGSVYVLLTGGIVLGELSSTAYRGDRGKIAYDHSLKTTGNPHNVTAAQVGAETPAGAQTKANTAETNAKNYADTLDSHRTVIKKNNNTYFDAVAQNFSKDLLEFTADLGEVIEVRISKDLVLSGGLQAISTGNNQLEPVAATGVTLIFPFGAGDKTIPKGLLSILATGTPNVYKIDGSLESNVVAQTIEATNDTGTVLDLSNVVGTNYNYAAFSSATTYTVGAKVINGFARCFINAASEPTVTGADKKEGSVFIPDTPMEMVVESPDGTAVEFYFILR